LSEDAEIFIITAAGFFLRAGRFVDAALRVGGKKCRFFTAVLL